MFLENYVFKINEKRGHYNILFENILNKKITETIQKY